MGTRDSEQENPGVAAASASAAPEGVLRRRRGVQGTQAEGGASAGQERPEANASRRGRTSDRDDEEDKVSDGKCSSPVARSRSTSSAGTKLGSATCDLGATTTETVGEETEGKHTAGQKTILANEDIPSSQDQQPTGSRLLIQVTPRIRKFLEAHVPHKKRKELLVQDRIDLDVLQRLVRKVNEKGSFPKADMADLVEGSQIVERIEAPPISLDKLTFSERLNLMAAERRHQAAVRTLWGDRSDRQDCFADINKSLAMGVNALLGIFLTFLGGYWAALYLGVENFQTRVVSGLCCSIVCLIVEVLLFVIHDERQRLRAKKKIYSPGSSRTAN